MSVNEQFTQGHFAVLLLYSLPGNSVTTAIMLGPWAFISHSLYCIKLVVCLWHRTVIFQCTWAGYSWKQKYSTPLMSSIICYSKQVVQHCVLCLQYLVIFQIIQNMISSRLRVWNNYVSMGSGGWILLQILDPYIN